MNSDVLEIYPTTDIHLIENADPVAVKVRGYRGSTLTGPFTITATGFDPNHVDVTVVSDTVTFAAKAALGAVLTERETIGKIVYTETATGNTLEEWVRIRVYTEVTRIWCGNNSVKMFKGESNYVLSVFAYLWDEASMTSSLADISSHPYLEYTPASSIISVDSNGRLQATTQGVTSIAVKIKGSTSADLVGTVPEVEVLDELSALTHDYAERVHGAGNHADRRNVLILSEGFDDQGEFDQAVQMLIREVFSSSFHSPYNLLKDGLNIWSAFILPKEASHIVAWESGISVGSPINDSKNPVPWPTPGYVSNTNMMELLELVSLVGLPNSLAPKDLAEAQTRWSALIDTTKLDQDLLDEWNKQKIRWFMQARNSALGFVIGQRLGDRLSQSPQTASSFDWYLPTGPVRRVTMDRRRMSETGDEWEFVNRFIATLREKNNVDPANLEIGKTFSTDAAGVKGADYGLVCILVNDQYNGGSNFGDGFAYSIGRSRAYTVTTSGTVDQIADHVPTFSPPDAYLLAHTFTHELSHSFHILDEYEGYDDPDSKTLEQTNTESIAIIDASYNIDHAWHHDPTYGLSLDVTKLKWNWSRIEYAAMLSEPAVMNGSLDKALIKVVGDLTIWQRAFRKGWTVFLRAPAINDSGHDDVGPYTIDEEPITEIKLTGPMFDVTDKFPKGSTLYVPQWATGTKTNTNPDERKSLILDEVISYIKTFDQPLYAKTADCPTFRGTRYPPDNIQGLKYPRYHHMLIGLYEGGGTFNCDVYSPTGNCRMREGWQDVKYWKQFLGMQLQKTEEEKRKGEFCFVCKYVLVNQIDPREHGGLDKQYHHEAKDS